LQFGIDWLTWARGLLVEDDDASGAYQVLHNAWQFYEAVALWSCRPRTRSRSYPRLLHRPRRRREFRSCLHPPHSARRSAPTTRQGAQHALPRTPSTTSLTPARHSRAIADWSPTIRPRARLRGRCRRAAAVPERRTGSNARR
jgi:hypothetical protein